MKHTHFSVAKSIFQKQGNNQIPDFHRAHPALYRCIGRKVAQRLTRDSVDGAQRSQYTHGSNRRQVQFFHIQTVFQGTEKMSKFTY